MANQRHVDILKQGVEVWNKWRLEIEEKQKSVVAPDLSGIDLSGMNLSGAFHYSTDFRKSNLSSTYIQGSNLTQADFRYATLVDADLNHSALLLADFSNADLRKASIYLAYLDRATLCNANLQDARLFESKFRGANLTGANLSGANLDSVDLSWANLTDANLTGASLCKAVLTETNFTRTNLSRADLTGAIFIKTNLSQAILTDCSVYGISIWDIDLKETTQRNLVITPLNQPPVITVDNLEVAQFIYLLLNNQKIRQVIDTITSKVVLILGRFTSERKPVLNALREELRNYNYSPVVFDFDRPKSQDLTETVSTLAHLARFIIIDLTDPSSAPHEMATIAPQCIRPIKPIISNELILKDGKEVETWREYTMFQDLRKRYHWILDTFRYQDISHLIDSLQDDIIKPVEEKITHWEPEKEKIKEQEDEIRKLREELEELKRGA
ncbi:hypothetical protein KSF_061410 [Reticulibacter mediterranei]|uniref:Pentapeptide repeat-containing protein n=1 Tax=Reticulibacter mediterranei TaxID=2778369 RepID=A0A8J3ILK5_9CHLR|nr:pentapeptide repeat-containing protein [Reticulibacter mediterranei]GHO96093.1 hypothetical protein KSF_061410 [Reticulibacter mediterranei]